MTTDHDFERRAALVERLVRAYNERDDETLLALVHPDFEFTPLLVRAGVVSSTYQGAEGLRRYLRDLRELWRDVRLEPRQVQPIGDTVVAVGSVSGHLGDRAVTLPTTWVMQMGGELVRRLVTFTDEGALRDAFGVPADEVALPDGAATPGFEVELVAIPRAVPAVRAALAGWLRRLGPRDDELNAILVSVSEAVANAVLHAYIERPVGNVRVAARVSGDELTVEVADEGRGMRPRADSPGLGMGLALISRFARAMTVASAPESPVGCAVRMAFPLESLRRALR